MSENGLAFSPAEEPVDLWWHAPETAVAYDIADVRKTLQTLEKPCYVVRTGDRIGVSHEKAAPDAANATASPAVCFAPPHGAHKLGDPDFMAAHGCRHNYYTGAMANGIASAEMVIALGKSGFMGSFGAGGLVPSQIEQAITKIQRELPEGPYAFNLIHSPAEPAIERATVELYLKYGVRCVETAAFMALTQHIVYYRVSGLSLSDSGTIIAGNRVIAKVSRREVATRFMEPAPMRLVKKLLEQDLITEEQAELSQRVPMADDITVEADSGGHTDNRPLVAILPAIIALRDEIQAQRDYTHPIRVGAGGGIGTPDAALAAYVMGAAYVVTGSVNQSCAESGASEHTKKLLGKADMADVAMAPAADMFELGVKLQVLKRGTLFAVRAQKLYNIYMMYDSIEDIPQGEREKLERTIFRQSLDAVWKGTVNYFRERDPSQIERTEGEPKKKMALIFRWYLGLASRWSNVGEPGREMDYQIWTGPSMGAFNAWVRGSYLEEVQNRHVADVAAHIMHGAAYLHRIQVLKSFGLRLPPELAGYRPAAPMA